jgi:predicted phage terminase large subunit-like protein
VSPDPVNIPPPEAAAAHPVAWPVYASGGRWRPARHLRFLGEQLLAMEQGRAPSRVVISCPPRHGKSWFISRYFPAWYLGRHPDHAVVLVTFQEGFSRKWGRLARDSFREHAEQLWGVTTLPRASTAAWEVYRNNVRTEGVMQSIGAQGSITGKGANLIIVDDLIRDLAEAQNATLRERQWEWFQSAVETRLEPPGFVVVISTRWHHDDLIGRIQKLQAQGELGDEWRFINLAAIAEDNDPLGRAPGEALWPERFPVEWLRKKERNVGPMVWGSLYQGRPVPTSGAVFKKDWLRYYTRGDRMATVPERGTCAVEDLERFATVDLAASKKKTADYTVIATWGYHRRWHVLLLLDLVRKRLNGDEIIPELKNAVAGQKLPVVYAEREGAFLAEKLGDVLKEAARQGVPVVELKPNGDKLARAIASTGPFAAHQVFFLERAPWLGALEEELLVFTGRDDAHDDQVDAVTYATAIFQEREAEGAPRSASPPSDRGPWLQPSAGPFVRPRAGPRGGWL